MNSKGTLLVVDDTPANLKLLVDTLTADGYEVLPADSGELALAAVAARPPELILLDIRMPDMDGFEVCRRLQARAESRDIPIIFVSAYGESAERVGGFRLGAVDFISKPIQHDELLARVQTHLELRRLRMRSEQQAADLQRTNEHLQGELAERQRSEAALFTLNQEMQASNSATLNLMDDAVEARNRLKTTNEELRGEIAGRRQAEQAQARLLRVLESSLNEIYVFDAGSLRFEYVNQGALRNLGYALETMRTMTPLDLKPEFDEVSFRQAIGPLLRHQLPQLLFQSVHRRADGSIYPVEVHLQLVEVAGQRAFLAVILDITARKQAQAKAAEQLDELRRWRDAMEGREDRVIEVKREVNELLARLGEPLRYPSAVEGSGTENR